MNSLDGLKDPARILEGENIFRLLVEAVADYAIYMLDPNGHVVSWNAGAERFKGYTPSEILGRHFSQFYTEQDRKAGLPARVLMAAAQAGKFEGEGWRVRKDGSRFWAHVVVDPIRDASGQLLGFAKITRDLTERKESERKLEQAREALFQSQKMEAIGQLTGGVAHDFNNLLSAVIGSLELAQRRIESDNRIAPLLSNALQAAQRGADLTQRMLAFARRQDLVSEPTDICQLVTGMVGLLDRTLGSGISITIQHSAGIEPVMVDRNQLEMAVLNLSVNARDAMPEGGPLIFDVKTQDLSEINPIGLPAGRYTVLSVIDHGFGMDEQTLKRAVEPFFTTKGIGKGTGLGLSMVHGLAEQIHGRLYLESAPQRGTTASLWIPVTRETARRTSAAGADESGQADLGPLDIIAVDDDALVLTNTAAMLEDAGHRVKMAYSAREALGLLKERTFDVLVTDQGMPGMTGTELIALVKKDHPNMAIVLATGYADIKGEATIDVPRVSKPFMQTQLLRGIHEAISKKPTPSPS